MLTADLGFRPAPRRERLKTLLRRAGGRFRPSRLAPGALAIPATVLHADPLVSYSGMVPDAPLGVASLLGGRMRTREAWFLLSPTWTLERGTVVRTLRSHAVLHRARNPRHHLVFLGNTAAEVARLRARGEAATLHNKTTHTSERIFRPLDGVPLAFDAIYNAQLTPWKRHELTLGIPRCAFLYYRGLRRALASSRESEAALIAHHARVAPGHAFLNDLDSEGAPVRMAPETINRHLQRASVGLCLSAEEGPMFACAEYLLSGLPVVTTPNRGGRDFYLDAQCCITVPPDPRAVAEGVATLKERGLPRDHVRKTTLRRIEAERRRFVELVDAVYAECGIAERFRGFWPLRRPAVMEWRDAVDARDRALAGVVDDLAPTGGRSEASEDRPGGRRSGG